MARVERLVVVVKRVPSLDDRYSMLVFLFCGPGDFFLVMRRSSVPIGLTGTCDHLLGR
jgi:hypothetical protein